MATLSGLIKDVRRAANDVTGGGVRWAIRNALLRAYATYHDRWDIPETRADNVTFTWTAAGRSHAVSQIDVPGWRGHSFRITSANNSYPWVQLHDIEIEKRYDDYTYHSCTSCNLRDGRNLVYAVVGNTIWTVSSIPADTTITISHFRLPDMDPNDDETLLWPDSYKHLLVDNALFHFVKMAKNKQTARFAVISVAEDMNIIAARIAETEKHFSRALTPDVDISRRSAGFYQNMFAAAQR